MTHEEEWGNSSSQLRSNLTGLAKSRKTQKEPQVQHLMGHLLSESYRCGLKKEHPFGMVHFHCLLDWI